jgi:hypothetical protein
MYNTDIPARAELPTTAQLIRSTIIAIAAAIAILVTIVLPSEYAIDPTGIGRALGLAEMGEIKVQLAEEAERDRLKEQQKDAPAAAPVQEKRSDLVGRIFAEFVVGSAVAQSAPSNRSDELIVTLKPGEGAEVKLTMGKGAKVSYFWKAAGGVVNFDLHGDGGGAETSYAKDRGVPGAEGVLEAAFDGKHGWFWRNRSSADVTITLQTKGQYSEIRRVL